MGIRGISIRLNKGDKFGRLMVLHEVDKIGVVRAFLCLCDCGNEKNVKLSALRNGTTQSCGCIKDELFLSYNTTHLLSRTNIYKVWQGVKGRCLNINSSSFKNYGGRGITFYNKWLNPEVFIKWALKNGYKKGLWLERINNDLGYNPKNCRWETPKNQQRNKRTNVYYTHENQTKCISEWAELLGYSHSGLAKRLKKFPIEMALKQK